MLSRQPHPPATMPLPPTHPGTLPTRGQPSQTEVLTKTPRYIVTTMLVIPTMRVTKGLTADRPTERAKARARARARARASNVASHLLHDRARRVPMVPSRRTRLLSLLVLPRLPLPTTRQAATAASRRTRRVSMAVLPALRQTRLPLPRQCLVPRLVGHARARSDLALRLARSRLRWPLARRWPRVATTTVTPCWQRTRKLDRRGSPRT
mmetsp:Transcript_5233/g.16810  ORF Transcript_5233/g.16810 Transcript_5233/m.16810 type:complete len:209 (+) Transcript_5233:151-777(+)